MPVCFDVCIFLSRWKTDCVYYVLFLSEMLYNHKIPSPRDDVTLEIIDTAANVSVLERNPK